MNKKIVSIIIVIFVAIVLLGRFLFFKDHSTNNDISQENGSIEINFNNQNEKYELGKVDIIEYKKEDVKEENSCSIIVTLENTMPEKVDLSKQYQLFVYGSENQLLTIVEGNALGSVNANSKIKCNMKVPFDCNSIKNVIIKETGKK